MGMNKMSVIIRTQREEIRDNALSQPDPLSTISSLVTILKRIRSPKWESVRENHIRKNGFCIACLGKNLLEVHHLLPFHLFPERELDPANLMTLCTDGPGGMNCHLVFGHGGDWKKYQISPREFCIKFYNEFQRTASER